MIQNKPVFVYKTYHPKNSPRLFGEQIFLHTLLKGLVEERESFEGLEGAIISVRANDNWDYIDQLNEDISKLKWCIIIITGNEDSSGFYRLVKHPNCKIWVQTPNLTDEADYFLGFGFPTEDCTKYLPKSEIRDIEISFAGQVNNVWRKRCVAKLETIIDAKVLVSGGFGQGLPYQEYLELLHRSKFAACPSAISTPDSFRIYEALESGCIPVLDRNAGELFMFIWGESPLLCVHDWDVFNLDQMPDFERHQKWCMEWWAEKKVQIVKDLFNHINQIS